MIDASDLLKILRHVPEGAEFINIDFGPINYERSIDSKWFCYSTKTLDLTDYEVDASDWTFIDLSQFYEDLHYDVESNLSAMSHAQYISII